MALNRTPIYQATVRPQLLLGCERVLVLTLAMVCALLMFSAQTFKAAALGVVLWFAGLYALRFMGKKDPDISTVYTRHVRYRRHYGPRATPFRRQ
jgi:type IV secretion system protein VirB3